MSVPRRIRLLFEALEQSEGVGARVRRSIGTPKLPSLSPFLMLDHFTIYPGSGFPDHPHRGQETITYLLSGAVDHEDFAGNKGTIWAGDLQFMTAGRGIMHAEMPRDMGDGSPDVGMQLWVDLPNELKSVEPRYRDLRAKEIPTLQTDDGGKVTVKVISGKSHGVDSVRDLAYTPVWILDITISPGGRISQEIPKDWNAFAYTLSGTVSFGDDNSNNVNKNDENQGPRSSAAAAAAIKPYHTIVFETNDTSDHITAHVAPAIPSSSSSSSSSSSPPPFSSSTREGEGEAARFILFAGQPLHQQVVQYGPFVLDSREGVMQAMTDFQTCSNGFERAEGWKSEIGKVMMGAR